jgi:hypothetical protein
MPTCRPLSTILGPFGGAQMPQKCLKIYFLVVSDFFSYKKEPIDLTWGLFLDLDIGTYIPPHLWALCTFLGLIRGAQMPQNRVNTHFLAVLDHFSYKNGPIDSVWDLFSNLDTGTYIRLTCTFLGHLGVPKYPKTGLKNYFLVVPDHFPYKNGPIDSVRYLFS